jgi:GT2 family glycosyltransferase
MTKPIPVLGIPVYNRLDLLERCLKSIDFPVDVIVIIDNSPEQNLSEEYFPAKSKEYCVVTHPNAGVAASWNEVIKLFPAPWWMLVNNDIEFAPGDLERMAKVAWSRPDVACGYGNHGASWWFVTEAGVDSVGLFDENIYPAYLEDCDWSYRADLLGIQRLCDVPGCRSRHGDGVMKGSCTAASDPKVRENNHRTHKGNFDYYVSKWGGINEKEVFRRPFNNPSLPLDYWKYSPARRARQQWTIRPVKKARHEAMNEIPSAT